VASQNSDFGNVWQVLNKVDLISGPISSRNELIFSSCPHQPFAISASAGTGFDKLIGALADHAEAYFTSGESAIVTRQRHRQALEQTVAALERVLAETTRDQEELIAENLRAAAVALGRLTGRVDVEDILDVIFRDFCIGK
jgi:tRNA modification GTPase